MSFPDQLRKVGMLVTVLASVLILLGILSFNRLERSIPPIGNPGPGSVEPNPRSKTEAPLPDPKERPKERPSQGGAANDKADAWSLRGRVLTYSGVGVQKVVVMLIGVQGGGVDRTETFLGATLSRAGGEYTIGLPAERIYGDAHSSYVLVAVSTANNLLVKVNRANKTRIENARSYDITFGNHATIEGFVTAQETGAPVDRAKVCFSQYGERSEYVEQYARQVQDLASIGVETDLHTDKQGRFSISLPAGVVTSIVVRKAPLAQSFEALILKEGEIRRVSISLRRRSKPATLTGKVIYDAGQTSSGPRPEVIVYWVRYKELITTVATLRVDTDGTFASKIPVSPEQEAALLRNQGAFVLMLCGPRAAGMVKFAIASGGTHYAEIASSTARSLRIIPNRAVGKFRLTVLAVVGGMPITLYSREGTGELTLAIPAGLETVWSVSRSGRGPALIPATGTVGKHGSEVALR